MKFFSFFATLSCLVVGASWAEEDGRVLEPGRVCAYYRAKAVDVPVYKKPDTTSQVVAKLSLGEMVCHIGEQGEFAILDWSYQEEINGRGKRGKGAKAVLVFARLADLWAPPSTMPMDLVEQAKRYFYYMREGAVPDDILAPFYPLIAPEGFEPKCRAGAICKRVEELQRQGEERENVD
jgi:hypothetical protein